MMFIYPKRWKVLSAFVVAAGMSMGSAGSVQAGEYCVDSCCEPDCVFTNAGDRLSGRIKSICGLWKSDDCCVDDCVEGCIDDSCVEGGCCDLEKESAWKVGGWAQMGYHTESNGMFNSNPNRINFQQNWLYVEKTADGSCGWDWGGRFDIMYGTDANNTQAFGNAHSRWDWDNGANISGGYGWAMPQAYLELAKGDFSVKAGHFYTPVGYEVVTAPDNFFYSHAMTMNFSEPFTHTGVLATHGLSDNVTAYYGWTLGWDTAFDQNNGGSNFLGGMSYSFTDDTSLTYMTTIGDLGWIGDGYSHSLVLDHTFGCSGQWNYVAQTDYVTGNQYNPVAAGVTEAYGLNQYLIYNVSDKVGVGSRFEWWRANSADSFSLTAGLNMKPTDHLIIRPEVRYFFGDPAFANNYNNNVSGDSTFDSFIFGIDAILVF